VELAIQELRLVLERSLLKLVLDDVCKRSIQLRDVTRGLFNLLVCRVEFIDDDIVFLGDCGCVTLCSCDLLLEPVDTVVQVLVVHELGLQLRVLPVSNLLVKGKDLLLEHLQLVVQALELLLHPSKLYLERLGRVVGLPLDRLTLSFGNAHLALQLPLRALYFIELLHCFLQRGNVLVVRSQLLVDVLDVDVLIFVLVLLLLDLVHHWRQDPGDKIRELLVTDVGMYVRIDVVKV